MAAHPSLKDPSPLHASNPHPLQNPPPSSPPSTTHILHCRFSGPPQTAFQALHPSLAAQEFASADPSISSRHGTSSFPQFTGGELQGKAEYDHHYHEVPREEEEEWVEEREVEGGAFEHRGSGLIKKCYQPHALPFSARTYENPRDTLFSLGRRTLENRRASVDEGGPEASVEEGNDVEASDDEDSQSSEGQQSSQGESENGSQHTDSSSSSGKGTINHLSLHDGEKGKVSPLRALSHIAHIKRKQACLQQTDSGQMHPDAADEFAYGIVHESSSKRKKLKQVQFQLEPPAYQKLMRILAEQHQGSVERFIMATLDSICLQGNSVKTASATPKKPAFAKWKRTRFDQIKGTETEELALAFKSLAESTPNVEVTSDLMHVPWQELNMQQLQKMLEETKRMLLAHEKVHDCPFPDCGRRFSTPGNLKDHLNEHRWNENTVLEVQAVSIFMPRKLNILNGSGEQPYSCSFEDCPHRFRSKQHLCRHMKKHERAHTCTFEGCNKRFAFRERLIVHQKIHSDERPLSCPWEGCGKTFKWANSLHGHMRTHTGEKPFQCTFAGCGRLFGYKVDLTRHRRTHFGQPARANH